MESIEIESILKKNIDSEKILLNESMKKHTSFKIGGNADFYIKANQISDIENIIKIANNNNIPLIILGNGSNTLVRDGGIRGIVLKIDLKDIDINKNKENIIVEVGAGFLLGQLSQKLYQEGIKGFEFASGIPGTIGGAIKMNAGAHGKEMKDVVVSTTYMNRYGEIRTISNEEHKFQYRNSIFENGEFIILNSILKFEYGNKDEIKKEIDNDRIIRKEKQPTESSAGSTFKRGNDFITAKLIDECGLKGYKIGDAQVSNKHAGFIINNGNAKAKDVLNLIEYVKKQVWEKCNKNIELEIDVLGEEE